VAGQGRTVDHSLVLVDGPIDAAGLYVPMTRGRVGNDVWVVADPTSPADAIDVLADVMQRRWIDEPAIEHADPAGIGSIDRSQRRTLRDSSALSGVSFTKVPLGGFSSVIRWPDNP